MKSRKILSLFLMIGFVFALTISAYGESYIKEVKAYFGTAKLRLNGEYLDKETVIIDGTTYVPLRAIGETLGLEVNWDDDIKTVDLTSIKAVDPTPSPKPTETAPLPTDTPAPTASPKPTEITTTTSSKDVFKTAEELEKYIKDKYGKVTFNIDGKTWESQSCGVIVSGYTGDYNIDIYVGPEIMYPFFNRYALYFPPPKTDPSELEYGYSYKLTEEENKAFKDNLKKMYTEMAVDIVDKMPESKILCTYRFYMISKNRLSASGDGIDIDEHGVDLSGTSTPHILFAWSNFGSFRIIIGNHEYRKTAEIKDYPVFFNAKYDDNFGPYEPIDYFETDLFDPIPS